MMFKAIKQRSYCILHCFSNVSGFVSAAGLLTTQMEFYIQSDVGFQLILTVVQLKKMKNLLVKMLL